MSSNATDRQHPITARGLLIVTLAAGILGLIVLLMPDGMMLTFLVSVSAITGLSTSHKSFDEREKQLLWQSYAASFEALFIAVYFAYAFVMLSNWLQLAVGVTAFVNNHWPGLVASGMCILLGVNGLRNFRKIE
jgi:hypothetical protein